MQPYPSEPLLNPSRQHTDFSQFIKLIGKGKKAGVYLSQSQAHVAMSLALSGNIAAEQLGAFLMLLRMREESVEELAGFLTACRKANAAGVTQLGRIDLDMGCYAGKRRHLPWLVLAVLLLAQQGYKIFLHGTAEPESQRLYLDKVFQGLGWQTATSFDIAKSQLQNCGFCYMDLQAFNPQLHHLIQLRSLFGLRSCANTLARMLNPSNAKCSLHGVFHREFDQRHAQVAALLNDDNVACFRGDGGEVEVNPERDFLLHCFKQQKQAAVAFPQILPQWQIKPRELSHEQLEPVWTGAKSDEYGEAAVIGTVAVMLNLIEDLSVEESLDKARTLWSSRDKRWPQVSGA